MTRDRVQVVCPDCSARLVVDTATGEVRALVGDQISVLPKARHWAVLNARKTIEIVKDTGDEIGDLIVSDYVRQR